MEQKQANQAEIKEGFSFLDTETYEALPLTRWLDKSGHPIPGHPELPVEKAAEIKILSKEIVPVEEDTLRLVQCNGHFSKTDGSGFDESDQEVRESCDVLCGSVAAFEPGPARTLSHEHKQPLIIGSNGASHTASDAGAGWIVRKEVTRDDPEWTAAVASLRVSEKVKIMSSRRQHEKNERDCRTIVQQLVSSIPSEILTSTSYGQKEQGSSKRKKTVTFVDQDKEGENVEQKPAARLFVRGDE